MDIICTCGHTDAAHDQTAPHGCDIDGCPCVEFYEREPDAEVERDDPYEIEEWADPWSVRPE